MSPEYTQGPALPTPSPTARSATLVSSYTHSPALLPPFTDHLVHNMVPGMQRCQYMLCDGYPNLSIIGIGKHR